MSVRRDNSVSRSRLVRLLDDQSRRWKSGERSGVESILKENPDLAGDADAVLDLIYNEIVQRDRAGERPAVEEFVGRFPHLGDAIRFLFEVHDALASGTPTPAGGTVASRISPELPGYEVIAELGRGGMGVVYKARDRTLNRVVAVKVLAPHLAAFAEARLRFLQEATAAAAVRHDNVVTVHAASEAGGQPFLVMEHVCGGSLQRRLEAGRPLDLLEVLRIGVEVAAGLAAAHARGVIHRDVKPGNVLLDGETGRAKLSDFGLARLGDSAGLTGSGLAMGTPRYMAPEQARGEAVDARADLYGLGAVIYHMAAGAPPNPARLLIDVNPDLPDWLADFVGRLMDPDPARRFGSAAEVEGLLRQRLTDLAAHSTPTRPAAIAPTPPPAARPARRRSRRMAVAAGAVAVAVIGVVGLSIWSATRPPSSSPTADGMIASVGTASPTVPIRRARQGVLMVLAPRDFYFPDYIMVRSVFAVSHIKVTVASATAEPAVPMPHPDGRDITPDLGLATARGDDYDAIVFCGGDGVTTLTGDAAGTDVKRLIREALDAKPPSYVTAVGTGPVVLAHAGILRGVRATVFPYGKPPGAWVRELEEHGAIVSTDDVVESGFIITGKSPNAAPAFARTVAERVKQSR